MSEIKLGFEVNGKVYSLKNQIFAHIKSSKHTYTLNIKNGNYTVLIDDLPHGEGIINDDFSGFGCDSEAEVPQKKEISPNI
jgi:hypothetical protein